MFYSEGPHRRVMCMKEVASKAYQVHSLFTWGPLDRLSLWLHKTDIYWWSPELSILNVIRIGQHIIFGGPVQSLLPNVDRVSNFCAGMICTWYVNCSSFNGDMRFFKFAGTSWLAEKIVIQSSWFKLRQHGINYFKRTHPTPAEPQNGGKGKHP